MLAFLASIHLNNWMKKTAFGIFLNDWGLTLAGYGSAVLKFVEKEGELYPEVIPWQRLIVDSFDFENNPKIEKLYFTPAQLRKNKSYNQELVESLIKTKGTRKRMSGQSLDNKSDYIEVYEVHGELPLSYLTEKYEDDDTYQQQMHVISFVSTRNRGKYDDYTLYSGREKQDPYMVTHLIKEEGQTLSNGAVKYLFESQWMVNHTAKLIKDQLELASKIVFQTSDGNFLGKNVLTNIENGDILTYQINQPLTQLNNKPDIVAMQSYGKQWQDIAREVTSTPEAIRGETMPSGTPYSLGAYLGNQAGSLFEQMTESKGLAIEEMMRKFIIPHLQKKMDTVEEIAATLESYQIDQIDKAFIPREVVRVANEQIKNDILNGKMAQVPDMMAIESQIQGKLNEFGNQRFIRPSEIKEKKWKDIFKDLIWEVEVEVTAEQQDKQTILQTLSTVMQTIVANPTVLNDPNMRLIFNRVLEIAGGISPLELTQVSSVPAQPPQEVISKQPAQSVGQPIGSGAGEMNLQTVK